MKDDLFGDVPQPEKAPAPEAKKPLTPDEIRARMLSLIAALRAAESIPFDPREFEKHIAMFPIMAQWLPDDEGKQLCFEFAQEVERLKKAA
jgi:hypothetical protein